MIGNRTVMNGSMCRRGFHVRRPSLRAVSSPWVRAAYPCAYSCATIESSRTGARRTKVCTWSTCRRLRAPPREQGGATAGAAREKLVYACIQVKALAQVDSDSRPQYLSVLNLNAPVGDTCSFPEIIR